MSDQTPKTTSLVAGSSAKGIIPTDFEQVMRFAKTAIHAGMFKNSDENQALAQATMAVLQGLELGIPPMQSIQQIAVINGRCTVWGDLVPALIWKAGHKIKEWTEGEGDARVAYCEITRGDNGEVIKRKFSVGDAKQANLWGKSGPWQQYKERMLQMRARGFCARDGVPDVLRGLYIREEIEEEERFDQARDVTPPKAAIEPPPAPTEGGGVAPAPQEDAGPPPAPEAVDADDFLSGFDVSLSACKTTDEVDEVWGEHEDFITDLPARHREQAQEICSKHFERIRPKPGKKQQERSA